MKKQIFLFCAATVLFSLILYGCVSVPNSPNSRFYMPASVNSEQALEKIDIAPGHIIAVGPIGIPACQDRPQIVTINKDGTFSFAQFERWGEPLDSSIARVIYDDLASLLPAASFQMFPCNFAISFDYQVVVDIIHLDSNLSKDMLFVAQWSVIDAKNRSLLLTKRSQFNEPVNPHNYFGVSRALGNACFSLSKEIAGSLSMLSKQPKQLKDASKDKSS
ncbi:MAG: PqiC family protein [Candidatus Omnitrophota bacterium]